MDKLLALIVEDDQDLSTIFAASLKAAGYQTQIISDGDVAVQYLQDTIPDVVVLDLHLPGVSGTEILQEIRADERLEKTKVIVSTADPTLGDPLRDLADLVLIKPISFAQLRDLAMRLKQM